MDKYIVIDVETANSSISSICQIGLAFFENGAITNTWKTLVNPCCEFDDYNIFIHGITEDDVKNAPTMGDLKEKILGFLDSNTICSYTFFDHRALSKHLDLSSLNWIDITQAVRKIWSELSIKGYGLKNVCKLKNINLHHHDALSDAIAAGEILHLLLEENDLRLSDIQKIINKKSKSKNINNADLRINESGKWYGEYISFTGTLSIPRKEAMQLASDNGFHCLSGVTKQTTFLVKGQKDLSKLAGNDLSSKEKKALKLIEEGQPITFISENDFFNLLEET